MNNDIHPSEMNLLQQYVRTVNTVKTTSRMRNPAWYQNALDLDVQVHCYLKNEGDVECLIYLKNSGTFEKIEGLTQRQLQMTDELENFVDRVLTANGADKPKALGVVFYLADELSIAGLGPEYQNPGDIAELREMMIEDPTSVLDDKTVSSETHAWRLFPYPGAPAGNEFATAVAVSRKHDETLLKLREIGCTRNLPIRTCALSAPLCALASLPWFTSAKESGTIGVYNYETFTVVSFYNKQAELMMLRYMPHSAGGQVPSNMGPAVMASATAFELESPEINVLSMVGNDVSDIVRSIQSSMMGSDILLVSSEEILKEKSLSGDVPLEMMIATTEVDAEEHPIAGNQTFTAFREEGWHVQDFLSPDQEEIDQYPDEDDLKLMKIAKRVKMVAALLLLGVITYAGLTSWNKLRSPAWTFKKQNNVATAVALRAELIRYEHWNNLLMDRSKAWVNMEFISRLTPPDGSVALKDVRHNVQLIPDKKSKKHGFKKTWFINGYTNEKGLRYLESISTREGIKTVFQSVAEDTGSIAFLPDVGQRDITVSLKQRVNPTYNSINPANENDRFRLTFTMSISQSFTGKDELSLALFDQGVKK